MREQEHGEESPLERRRRIRAMSDVTPSWEYRPKREDELDPDAFLNAIADEAHSAEEREQISENTELLQEYSRARERYDAAKKRLSEIATDRVELVKNHPLFSINLALLDTFHAYQEAFARSQHDQAVRGTVLRSVTEHMQAHCLILEKVLADAQLELMREKDDVGLAA